MEARLGKGRIPSLLDINEPDGLLQSNNFIVTNTDKISLIPDLIMMWI